MVAILRTSPFRFSVESDKGAPLLSDANAVQMSGRFRAKEGPGEWYRERERERKINRERERPGEREREKVIDRYATPLKPPYPQKGNAEEPEKWMLCRERLAGDSVRGRASGPERGIPRARFLENFNVIPTAKRSGSPRSRLHFAHTPFVRPATHFSFMCVLCLSATRREISSGYPHAVSRSLRVLFYYTRITSTCSAMEIDHFQLAYVFFLFWKTTVLRLIINSEKNITHGA